ncbi:MAG: hypothetical protein JO172_08965 [Hyphomicrobiales bacterium]|nr:hypothetical protein [Hyphomicrobiales bacterium]
MPGVVVCGPYRHLLPGTYRFRLRVSGTKASGEDDNHPVAILEIVSRREYIDHRLITLSDLAKGEIELDVDVTTEQALSPGFSVETRFRTLVAVQVAISALSCERVSDLKPTEPGEARALLVKEWLPLLWTGHEARRKNGNIFHSSAKPSVVFFGPYWSLPEGNYEAIFTLQAEAAGWAREALIRGYVRALRTALGSILRRARGLPGGIHGGRFPLCTIQAISRDIELASKMIFVGNWRAKKEVALPFTVTTSQSEDPDFGLEFRLLAHTQLPFGFKSVVVRRIAA